MLNNYMSKSEKQFQPGIKGAGDRPSLFFWVFPALLFLFTITLIVWMIISEIDVISPATAKIISSSGLNLVQPNNQGKIASVPVKEGDEVKKGMVLVEFEKDDIEIEIEGIKKERQLIQADVFRLEYLLSFIKQGTPSIPKNIEKNIPKTILKQEKALVESQIGLYKTDIQNLQTKIEKTEKDKNNLEAEIIRLKKMISIITKKTRRLKPLINEKVIPYDEYEQLIDDKSVKEEDIKIKKKQLLGFDIEIRLKQEDLQRYEQNFINENNQKLLDAYQKIENLELKSKKIMELLKSKTILSPIDGFVHHLQLYTKGTVVRPGEVMMQIVPKDSALEVEAKVLNKDIGFVEINQKIKFKLDSFPFTKYGYIPGKVKKIESASVKDERLGEIYPTIIELEDNKIKVEGKWVRVIPGMTGVVDIHTGKRQVIEYIISPFLRYKDQALKER